MTAEGALLEKLRCAVRSCIEIVSSRRALPNFGSHFNRSLNITPSESTRDSIGRIILVGSVRLLESSRNCAIKKGFARFGYVVQRDHRRRRG